MRTAVMRVVVDADGTLSPDSWEQGLARLRERGVEVVSTPTSNLPPRGREVELVIDAFTPSDTDLYVKECSLAFETESTAGVVTFVSRGTDADARGVLDAFKVGGAVERRIEDDEEVVIVTLDPADVRRVPESRLHTALEAALNCEVRILT